MLLTIALIFKDCCLRKQQEFHTNNHVSKSFLITPGHHATQVLQAIVPVILSMVVYYHTIVHLPTSSVLNPTKCPLNRILINIQEFKELM